MPATYTVGDSKTYSTIQAAIDAVGLATGYNLVGQGIQTIEVYDKAPSGYAEVLDAATGFTGESSSNYINIVAMKSHQGKVNTGIIIDAGSVVQQQHIQLGDWCRLHGFEITCSSYKNGVANNAVHCINGDSYVYDNLIHDVNAQAGSGAVGVNTLAAGVKIFNNAIWNIGNTSGSAGRGIFINAAGASGREKWVINNSVYNCKTTGIDVGSYNYVWLDNNYSGSNTTSDFNITGTPANRRVQYNISSDATATGTGALTSKAAANQFTNLTGGSENFRLLATADCKRTGYDDSGLFTTDFKGVTRSSWNTGADEYSDGTTASSAMMMQII